MKGGNMWDRKTEETQPSCPCEGVARFRDSRQFWSIFEASSFTLWLPLQHPTSQHHYGGSGGSTWVLEGTFKPLRKSVTHLERWHCNSICVLWEASAAASASPGFPHRAAAPGQLGQGCSATSRASLAWRSGSEVWLVLCSGRTPWGMILPVCAGTLSCCRVH